jgi:hypothetical protein
MEEKRVSRELIYSASLHCYIEVVRCIQISNAKLAISSALLL